MVPYQRALCRCSLPTNSLWQCFDTCLCFDFTLAMLRHSPVLRINSGDSSTLEFTLPMLRHVPMLRFHSGNASTLTCASNSLWRCFDTRIHSDDASTLAYASTSLCQCFESYLLFDFIWRCFDTHLRLDFTLAMLRHFTLPCFDIFCIHSGDGATESSASWRVILTHTFPLGVFLDF